MCAWYSSVEHMCNTVVSAAIGASHISSHSHCNHAAFTYAVRVPLLSTTLGLSAFARPAAAATFASSASIIDQVTFKEMGMLSWLIVDVAIQWAGWAVSAALKVSPLAAVTLPWHGCGQASK